MGFKLRNTQRLAIMKLLKVDSLLQYNTFSQVKTGEGKSIIVTGLAIGYAIMNKTNGRSVDVITSNDIIAIRDSSLSI